MINRWIGFYRTDRPHQEIGYLTPAEYRANIVAVTGSTVAPIAA